MKRNLKLKLFGPPKVYVNQKDIRFSFSKMEALLYYLAVMGEVNRDEIAGILWGDKENQVARKNLRNTVYQANKIFEGDVIVSPSRSSLALNPDLDLHLDVQLFERDPIRHLNLYQGDFLEGFYVKDDEDFDQWASRKRNAYKQLYIESCYQKIDQDGFGDPSIESLLHHLVELDEFEEKNYQLLMEYYRFHHQLGKFFETYYKLVDLLDRELSVRPSRAIEELYHSVLEAKRTHKLTRRSNIRELSFFGRKQELSQLEDYLSLVEVGESSGPLLVLGQSGTGKKRLLRQLVLMSNRSFLFVRLEAKLAHQHQEGRSWKMMDWSEGSPFILSSYIEEWKEKESLEPLPEIIQAYLAQELGEMTSEEESILQYLSCFHKPISMRLLADLTVVNLEMVTGTLDSLSEKGILRLEEEGELLSVCFNKQLVGMYFYQLLSPARRRLFHQQIAKKLEETLEDSTDLLFYKEIAYQYKQSQNLLRSLSFELNYLEEILQLEHELFPIFYKGEEEQVVGGANSHLDIIGELTRLCQQVDDLFPRYQKDKDYKYLQLRYLYLEGRYSIRTGEYQKGIHAIQKVISYARELKHLDYLLEGYRQIIYYCIQTENISEMAYYTDLALEDAIQANNHEAIALQLRLKGLYYLMVGDEEQATRHLYRSIDCFSLTRSMQDKYAIQIAASLAYLAEIEQIRGHFQVAVTHLEEVLNLVGDQAVESVRVVFDIDLGIAYYWQGDFAKASLCFDRAQKVLSRVSFPWKEDQLEFYQTLIACQQGEQEKVADYLARKEISMKQSANPRDKGMVHYLLAFLLRQEEKGAELDAVLLGFLREDMNYYRKVAEQQLNPYRDRQFLKKLKEM